MILLLINPILWFPVSIGVYVWLRKKRPEMDKVTATIIATGIVPLIIVFIARRFQQ